MPRTCRTCLIIYCEEHPGLRFCPNCGERLWLSPAWDAESRYGALTDNDWPAPQTIYRILLPPHALIILDRSLLPSTAQTKSPALAALLSFLLVGMGQVYLGQVEKGLVMIGIVLLLILTVRLGPLEFFILLFNVLDAALLAWKAKAGEPIQRWEFFFSLEKTYRANG